MWHILMNSLWTRRIGFALLVAAGWVLALNPLMKNQLDLGLRIWLGSTGANNPLAYPFVFAGAFLITPIITIWSWGILAAAVLRTMRTRKEGRAVWYLNTIAFSIAFTPFVLIREIWLIVSADNEGGGS